ncbi:hypothetical protein OMR07_02805 [Methylobacterium organophilum]|nr:hypothetical protein [Methylobacterium organophilum]
MSSKIASEIRATPPHLEEAASSPSAKGASLAEGDTWLAEVARVSALLPSLSEDAETWPQALLQVWRLMERAPGPVRKAYGRIREGQIRAEAERLGIGPGLAPLEVSDCSTEFDCLLRIGGWLRATETVMAALDSGRSVARPNEAWRHDVDGDHYFIIPMVRGVWRGPIDDSDKRPFSRRGLVHCRILPALVGGVPVRLIDGRSTTPQRPDLVFSASLFAGLKFEWEADDETFLITRVYGPARSDIEDHLGQAAQAGCTVHVFPELTLDPALRSAVREILSEASWQTTAEDVPSPDIIVAGSWHDDTGQGFCNQAVVYGAGGTELLRFQKFFAFRDEDGKDERIVPGRELKVLVGGHGLYGFGICLDLCEAVEPILTRLDVDWILLPSCGGWRTMEDHLRAAATLQSRFDTRCFVVQQAYPAQKDGTLGYVLPAPEKPRGATEDALRRTEPFSSHTIIRSDGR